MILRKRLNTLVTLEIVEFLVNIRYYLQYCHDPLFSLTTSSSIISHKTFSIIRGLHVQIQTSIEPDYYNYIYIYNYSNHTIITIIVMSPSPVCLSAEGAKNVSGPDVPRFGNGEVGS